MRLDLTDEEAAALLRLLNRVIADDRYPLSPRIRLLRAIRAKFPGAPPEPPPARPPTPKNGRQGERRALVGDRGSGSALVIFSEIRRTTEAQIVSPPSGRSRVSKLGVPPCTFPSSLCFC